MTAGPRSDSAATLCSPKSALWSVEPDDDVQDTSADERKTRISYRHVSDRTDAPCARTVSPRSLPVAASLRRADGQPQYAGCIASSE